MSNRVKLTDEQKTRIVELFKQDPDIKKITQEISGDQEMDGRSKLGRAIGAFLRSQNREYQTAKVESVGLVELSDQQKQFIMSDNVELGMTPLEIARLVFQNPSIASLSKHHRTVLQFLKEQRPEVLNDNELVTTDKWTPPTAISRVVKKVNDWAAQELVAETISNKNEKMMKTLIKHLHSPRFKQTINEYSKIADRELFESEFVRAVWDKPDLTTDELNQYVTLCANYVRIKHIQMRLDRLNKILEDQQADDAQVTIRFTELIKATSEELNNCEKRIGDLTKSLNGSRQDRLKARGQRNGSIEALIEAFQDKEERDRMIRMAEMRQKTNRDEADRLEGMDEFKARVLGISKEELL